MQSHCGRLGYIPEIIVYDDAQDCRGKLGRLFRKLFREEGVSTDDVTLLSARNPKTPESVLKPTDLIARYGLRFLNSEQGPTAQARGDNKVDLATISGFKGLETPIAILLNVSEYRLPLDNPIMASLVYVACTRAKHMLYIMVQKDDPKRAVFEAALKAIQSTGGMVLEGSEANFEFVGMVSHYNPDRLGWLTVNDPAFEKSSIMFFPHDVKLAGLESLKNGDNLRFRPRVEGQSTIATDLKVVNIDVQVEEEPSTKVEAEKLLSVPVQDQSKSTPQVEVAEVKVDENIVPRSRPKKESARKKARAVKAERMATNEQTEAAQVQSRQEKPILGLKKK